jgi:DNA-binding MarR family transcriptional regulator
MAVAAAAAVSGADMPAPSLSPAPSSPTAGGSDRDAAELLSALRSLFTCTRKVRSWVSDAGPMTVLGVVAEHGEARVSALAASLVMDTSTVSRQLAALCRGGLVQWRPDESDLRSHLVSCTPAGLDRLNARRAELTQQLTDRLHGWCHADVTELSRLLNLFVSSVLVDEPGAEPVSPDPAIPAKESA